MASVYGQFNQKCWHETKGLTITREYLRIHAFSSQAIEFRFDRFVFARKCKQDHKVLNYLVGIIEYKFEGREGLHNKEQIFVSIRTKENSPSEKVSLYGWSPDLRYAS